MTPILCSEPFVSTAKKSPAYWLVDSLWITTPPGADQRRLLAHRAVDAIRIQEFFDAHAGP